MKSTSDRTTIASASFGSLMDPAYVRQAVNDSQAYTNQRPSAGFHPFNWNLLRSRVKSFSGWVFHRTPH